MALWKAACILNMPPDQKDLSNVLSWTYKGWKTEKVLHRYDPLITIVMTNVIAFLYTPRKQNLVKKPNRSRN
jgi:hypothetical protein